MKKQLIISLILIILCVNCIHADDLTEKIVTARDMLHQGFDESDEEKLLNALAIFQRLLLVEDDKWLIHFYIGYSDYRIATYYSNVVNQKDKADKYYDDAIENLRTSKELNRDFPETYALISSCYGGQININSWKGMMLGPRSGMEMGEATSLGPENPRVWLHSGIGSYFTPGMFGGGKDKAIEELKKSISLYEKEPPLDAKLPQWGYDEAHIWLGIVLKSQKKYEEARKAFEKALEINPNNGWVKYSLLPELNQTMGSQ